MRSLTDAWLKPGSSRELSESLAQEFRTVFSRACEGSWFAPGRANLNGEHIDFHGGRCLPLALDYGTYVAAAARDDGVLRLRTLDATLDTGIIEIPQQTRDLLPATDPSLPSWTRYVLGVLWALQGLDPQQQLDPEMPSLRVDPNFGADVLIRSTLPIGGGLSSSASLECAVALAFLGLGSAFGAVAPGENLSTALTDADRAMIAQACIRAEVEVVGAGTGGLDQNASMRSSSGSVLSLDCRNFSVRRLNISSLERDYQFLAVDTAQPHQLADGAFSARRVESEFAAAVLGVEQLRQCLPERPHIRDVEASLREYDRRIAHRLVSAPQPIQAERVDPESARRRLKHALTEMLRSEQIHELLLHQDHGTDVVARSLGEHLLAGHHSMKRAAEVSFDRADQVVRTAVLAGACGARLIGGGFGGSVLILSPREEVDAVAAACARISPDIRFLAVTPAGPALALS